MHLNTYLKRNQIGRREFSRKLGKPPNWATRILNGDRTMSLHMALRIVKLTGSVVEFVDLKRYLSDRSRLAFDYSRRQRAQPTA